MDAAAVLAAFDAQIRRRLEPDEPGMRVEADEHVVRVMTDDGWNGVVWSDLDEASADAVVAAEVARFAGTDWEWKHYSYDRPADLPQRLVAAGLVAEEVEALLVADVRELALDVRLPEGVRLEPVVDQAGVDALVRVHEEVFGGDHSRIGRALAARLAADPGSVAAVVAMAGDVPISSGRLELTRGTDFASLWGGGTLAEWRGRGVFRALVAHRARLAADAGYRYLQVDASADSRPILRRLGFTELALTTPFVPPS
ncbi:GNAT family N-acetyltransferase [Angustibacter peucedani]